MIYECKHCGYTTNRQLNLIRHENRKNPCKKTTNGGGESGDESLPIVTTQLHLVDTSLPIVTNLLPDVLDSQLNMTNSETSKLTCNKCNKEVNRKDNLKRHEEKCKGLKPNQCDICLKIFTSRHGKYKHKKNVICQPPTIPLSQLVNQHPFDTDTTEYIYLLQTRESLRNKETIYKVGRTCKEGLQRFKFYPKGSKLLLHIFCFDSVTVEKKILSQFNDKFKNASTYGKEYFDGDLTEMVSIVLKEVSSTFNCCFSMTGI